jgi:hypothetical protein
MLAVAGSEIDRRCGVLGDEFLKLAEADVLHPSAGNYAHLELPIMLGLASSLCGNTARDKFISGSFPRGGLDPIGVGIAIAIPMGVGSTQVQIDVGGARGDGHNFSWVSPSARS